MSPSSPDVTAVIACFNYGRYLREAVESAAAQGAHVLVVDDGSDDSRTHAVLDALEREGHEVIRQENRGVCAARNAGLARAVTPYVMVLDADDRLAPGALAAMREPLDADESLGFAYGSMRFFGAWEGLLRFPPYDPYKLLHRHTIGLSALMRREVAADTGGFDAAFEEYEDWELWVNALAHGWRGRQVDAVTLDYRRHANSKQLADRRRYRHHYAALRRKHGELYRRAGELARESGVGMVGRLVYRWFWGARPVPATVESLLHRLRWGSSAITSAQ